MTSAQSPEAYLGLTAVDSDRDKIGSVNQVYVNDESNVPDWITVNTGLFGMRENFVPLQGSTIDGDTLVLPFGKDVVKNAPDVADASHLDPEESADLYSYYQQHLTSSGGLTINDGDRSGREYGNTDLQSETSDGRTAEDTTSARTAAPTSNVGTSATTTDTGYDTSGPTTDDAMTRSEEHLRVGTEQVEAGRARLRKYVVTEQQTVTVPVSHEEVRIEREPITDANRGDAFDGPSISEEEHEVVLHAERPVVTTEAVAVERVRLGTETVTEQQDVSGEVRKEQIEVEDGSTAGSYTNPSDKR